MIIDGRTMASAILAEVRAKLGGRTPIVRAVVVHPTPATESYLKIKTQRAEEGGMRLDVVRVDDETDEAVIAAVLAPGADAVIVQLPIPEHLDLERILSSIPVDKDPDVLSAASYARFDADEPGALVPPVAQGVWEMLVRSGVDVKGKNVAVVGRGQLVGKPCATLLSRNGAVVTIVSRSTSEEEKAAVLRAADIIISGAGQAHIITPDLVKNGAVLIDAGTSGSKGGVAGDIDPACADKASLLSPVPGGVGPVAVACLFLNTAKILEESGQLA